MATCQAVERFAGKIFLNRIWRLSATVGVRCFVKASILWTWGSVWHAKYMDSRQAERQHSKERQQPGKRAHLGADSTVSALKRAQGRDNGTALKCRMLW